MIESATEVTEFSYPGSAAVMVDADVADWMEQRQVVPLPDDDYPHQSRFEHWAN